VSEGTQYVGKTLAEMNAMFPNAGTGEFSIGGKLWPGLSKLIEEAGEVMQVAGKLIGSEGRTDHWSGNLDTALIEELGDLAAAMEFFVLANGLDMAAIGARRERKLETFRRWHEGEPA